MDAAALNPAQPAVRVAAAGPLVAVCGLHGGAGTTTIAALLATRAAARTEPGGVLLADSDPSAGGLALHLGLASAYNLAELAALRSAGRPLEHAPFADLPAGVRLCAAAPAPRATPTPGAVGAVLAEARSAHALTVLDAGPLSSVHAQGVLEHADVVVLALAAHTSLTPVRRLLASPLVRAARAARWALAVSDVGHAGPTSAVRELAELVPTAGGCVLVPRLDELSSDDDQCVLAGAELLELVA